ncbi:MAG: hypothetical protein QOF51_694, partial [Chloroflexota bacterium]|nr:hypothetical protein [Chloroflexota bacterium]
MNVAEGQACIPNIGPRERRRRLLFGVAAVAVGAIASAILTSTGTQRWWRLPLFALFWVGGAGIFQARDQTCIRLAAEGQRNLDSGAESIEDTTELAQVRHQARKVRLESGALAAA